METIVALLRGINVGGHNRLAMAELRRVAASIGLHDPKTHLQSGNLIAGTDDAASVGSRLSTALADATGLDVAIVVRTADEWRRVASANPYASEPDGKLVHVLFLAGSAGDDLTAADWSVHAPDELTVTDHHAYLKLPGGMADSRLAVVVQRAPSAAGATMRNLNTIRAISNLVEQR